MKETKRIQDLPKANLTAEQKEKLIKKIDEKIARLQAEEKEEKSN